MSTIKLSSISAIVLGEDLRKPITCGTELCNNLILYDE